MDLTIAVPTRDEADSIKPLVNELSHYVLPGTTVMFIDDSDDDATIRAVKEAAAAYPELDIQFRHRLKEERRNGLAGAITTILEIATSDLVLVMDADLQHPPAVIPSMITAARKADLVVASRYCPGGSASGLNGPLRYAVSRLSNWGAKILFPYRLRNVSDPMTGCFVVHRRRIDTRLLQASGFKILLELLAQHPQLSRIEVPIQFAARANGASKGSLAVGQSFLRQLYRLRFANQTPLEA